MKYYQVKELSELTSTTVRTLQYYDEIGLLKPSKRTDSDYRLYSEDDLLQLQQIITLKYLGLSLSDIKIIMINPGFNVLKSLHIQSQTLSDKAEKIHQTAKLLKYIAAQIEAGQAINWESTATIIKILEMTTMNENILNKYQTHEDNSELGKKSDYEDSYNPKRLYPIPRIGKRREIGITSENLPFFGFDCWNHYEVSWLNNKGKPIVAIAEIIYDCYSPLIIESKSLKLYFNSFNNSKFNSMDDVTTTIKKDLENAIEFPVTVTLNELSNSPIIPMQKTFMGESIDGLDVTCTDYTVNPNYLTSSNETVEETLYSDLLKSNCLVTKQPDWGSVQISYKGNKIGREGLLKYIVSFRNHNEFHEQCIERIFMDIMRQCKPKELTVYGRYTRRGGLDINPYRSTSSTPFHDKNFRLIRQ